jgi:hypothetical protein
MKNEMIKYWGSKIDKALILYLIFAETIEKVYFHKTHYANTPLIQYPMTYNSRQTHASLN